MTDIKSLAKRYNFSDFTEKHYITLIKLAKKKYLFEPFTTKTEEPHVLWRHDVDSSVHRALKLAKIEKKLGVKSTYFLRLHSEWYNLFEKEVYDKINNIIKLGHYIGLHFEYKFYPKYKLKFKNKIKIEKKILEEIFPTKINAISFHQPFINNKWTNPLDDKILGLVNTYGKKLQKKYFYCSDSNGYWKYNRLIDVLKKFNYSKLQVLTHPEIWQKRKMAPRKRYERCANMRAIKTMQRYDKELFDDKRINIY